MKPHPCHACGYDVREQTLGAPCPECAAPVRPPTRLRRRRERSVALGVAAVVLMAAQFATFTATGVSWWFIGGFLVAWITVKVNAMRFLLDDVGPPAWPMLVAAGALVLAGIGLFFSMCGLLWLGTT